MQWNEFSFRIRHLTTADKVIVQKAFQLGEKAHANQTRESGEPYFTHPIAVANILIDMGADADTIAAALLHDTVEDTFVTLSDIERDFNPAIAALVDGVTKLMETNGEESVNTNNQIETMRKIFTLMQKDVRIMVIKLSDRLHNMLTIGYRPYEKQRKIAKETLDIYVKIADRLCMRDMRDMLEDLCRAVLEPDMHARVTELRKKNEQRCKMEISYIHSKLEEEFGNAPYCEIKWEQKTWEKMRMQYDLENNAGTGISSINIAFVCNSLNDCYLTLGILHQLWRREVLTFEDFANAPVINGYKAVHTTIILEDGTRVRCKIRTTEMEEYAHKGVTMFCFDRKALGALDYLPWVNHISPLSEDTAKRSEKFWESLQSDILGESIVVQGAANANALIPRGSTVLDAVLYLYGTQGLRLESVIVNDKPAKFYDEVQNASTVIGTFAPHPVVELQWLQYVHTGIASALIRQELSKQPEHNKETLGREILNESFKRIARIGLDELSPSVLKGQLKNLQVASESSLYIEVAEGRLNPDHVARSIFHTKEDTAERTEWVMHVNAPTTPDARVERAIRMYPFIKMSYNIQGELAHLKAIYSLTAKQVYELQNALSTVLKPDQWSLERTSIEQRLMFAMIALVVLWGLDPVFARRLVETSVDPVDLTVVRFVTFFIASTVAYFGQRFFIKQKLKPLSPLQTPLILSGVALFITGLFTYVTLAQIQASQYIVFIIAGLVLANLIKAILARKQWLPIGFSFLLLAGGLLIITYAQHTSMFGILTAIASSLGFACYSEISRNYQQEVTTIQARYPAFMFWVSTVCLVLSILIFPFIDFNLPSTYALFQATAFAVVFAVLPYLLFFETSRRTSSKFLDNSLPFVFISTIVGELLVFHNVSSLFAAPVLLIFLWQYVTRRKNGSGRSSAS